MLNAITYTVAHLENGNFAASRARNWREERRADIMMIWLGQTHRSAVIASHRDYARILDSSEDGEKIPPMIWEPDEYHIPGLVSEAHPIYLRITSYEAFEAFWRGFNHTVDLSGAKVNNPDHQIHIHETDSMLGPTKRLVVAMISGPSKGNGTTEGKFSFPIQYVGRSQGPDPTFKHVDD